MEDESELGGARGSALRSGLTLVLLFAAGLVLGLCLMEPSLLQNAWQALSDRGRDTESGPVGLPGEEVWRRPPGDSGDAWFRVLVGTEGAFEEAPPPAPPSSPPAPTEDTEDEAAAIPPASFDAAATTSVVVPEGATLWSLAVDHYGAQLNEALLQTLARYNRLESANRLESGQRLWLPPVEQLLGAH